MIYCLLSTQYQVTVKDLIKKRESHQRNERNLLILKVKTILEKAVWRVISVKGKAL